MPVSQMLSSNLSIRIVFHLNDEGSALEIRTAACPSSSASCYPFVCRRKPNHPLIGTKASECYLQYIAYCIFSDLHFLHYVIRDVLHSHTLELPELYYGVVLTYSTRAGQLPPLRSPSSHPGSDSHSPCASLLAKGSTSCWSLRS